MKPHPATDKLIRESLVEELLNLKAKKNELSTEEHLKRLKLFRDQWVDKMERNTSLNNTPFTFFDLN